MCIPTKCFFPTAPATAPQSLTIFEVSATNISIQWEGVDCNGDTTGYLVQYGVTGTGITQTISTNLSTTEATISRLLPSTSYSIEVAAVNGVLIGPYSPAITQLTEGLLQNGHINAFMAL